MAGVALAHAGTGSAFSKWRPGSGRRRADSNHDRSRGTGGESVPAAAAGGIETANRYGPSARRGLSFTAACPAGTRTVAAPLFGDAADQLSTLRAPILF